MVCHARRGRRPHPPIMIRAFVSSPSSPDQRGAQFGHRFAEDIHGTVNFYRKMFSALHGLRDADVDGLGARFARRLAEDAPQLLSEIAGMARAASVPMERLVAINARTEILAGASAPECSVIGVDGMRSATGTPVLAQNWDWHPDLRQHLVLWTIHDDAGSMTTLTEAGILAKIGRNDRGIAVCLNILSSSADGGANGMPIHILLRLLMQRCDGWSDVEQTLHQYTPAASSAISVASARDGVGGRMGTFEMSPAGAHLIEPRHGLLLHTNHFLRLPNGYADKYRADWPDTVKRFDDLSSTLADRSAVTVEDIKSALRSHRAGEIAVCCHDDAAAAYPDRQATLASVMMDLGQPGIDVAPGNPCQNDYTAAG